MYIVPGLDDVKIACITLKVKGVELFGFLLYSDSDRVLVDYMKEGIFELDIITGNQCVLFVIEPPSKKWFSYVKQKQHIWWDSYGTRYTKKRRLVDKLSESLRNFTTKFSGITVDGNSNCTIVIGNDNSVRLDSLIQEEYNVVFDRQEALNIAKHFGVEYRSLPCIVFFNELEGNEIVIKYLGNHKDQTSIKNYLRSFFDSEEFKKLIESGV
ncbi:hypothetical protein [Bacillus sp. FJAT-27251]|uniref:hypothetical protein n=1 Tax=Bacillus sp. FJAT-27251 TaxID=1684142 RepID=UPI0006A7CA69|nr:hypothetical protein [Bacillus sp. FJAT-27251]